MNPNPSSSFGGFKETNINQFLKFRPKSLLFIKKEHTQKKNGLINDLTIIHMNEEASIKRQHE